MYIIRIIIFLLSIIFLFNKLTLIIEFLLMTFNSICLEFLIYLDWISLMFLSLVIIISRFVLIYRLVYIENDVNIKRFFILVLIFVLRIVFLIICPNFMGLLLGWDGLGLTSYCLIIYYQNWKSYNSGIITVLINRIGDVGIIIIIRLYVILGSWNGLFYDLNFLILSLLIILRSITKSAQLPFSIWLPLAMAAPTPVSSLVHSSTLVTAGVYLLIRYNFYIINDNINEVLLFISRMTILISGLIANFECDLKKIIALSTLRQLGLIIRILRLGRIDLSYFHLIIHALFKSLLFLCRGVLIHQIINNQDIRFIGNLINNYPFVSLIFFMSTLSLCGFPFFSGFYSKDLIIEIFLISKINYFRLIILFLATLFTVSYRVRLLLIVYLNYRNKFNGFVLLNEDNLMSLSIILLYLISLIIGYFLLNLFSLEIVILRLIQKILVIYICLIGIFLGIVMRNLILINWLKNIKIYLIRIWGLRFFYELINFYPLKYSLIIYKRFDKGFIEYRVTYGLKKFLVLSFLKLFILNFFLYLNLFVIFIILFILIVLIFYLNSLKRV